MKKYILVILLIILSLTVYILISNRNINQNTDAILLNSQSDLRHDAKIIIGSQEIFVEKALSSNEFSKGLSEKFSINENEGMLFVFNHKTYPIFWMKGMLFPLDFIWISDEKIVHIDENIPAPTQDQKDSDLLRLKPTQPVNYVLEVNAGYSQKYSIKEGDSVKIIELR